MHVPVLFDLFLDPLFLSSLLVGVAVVDVLALTTVVGVRSLSRLPTRRYVLCSSGPCIHTYSNRNYCDIY